jgi:hypothetical protein
MPLPVSNNSTVLPSMARTLPSLSPSEDELGLLLQVNTMDTSLMIDDLMMVAEVDTVVVEVDTEVVVVTVRPLSSRNETRADF